MILSFQKTVREFLSGNKTETRRDWKPRTLAMWQRSWDKGHRVHVAVDKGLHRGGKRIGLFELTARPYQQEIWSMTKNNLRAEGGMCNTIHEFAEFVGKRIDDVVTVITFRRL